MTNRLVHQRVALTTGLGGFLLFASAVVLQIVIPNPTVSPNVVFGRDR